MTGLTHRIATRAAVREFFERSQGRGRHFRDPANVKRRTNSASRFSRRSVLGSSAAAFIAAKANATVGLLSFGRGSSAPSNLIKTMSIQNTSSSTQTANAHPNTFGCAFKKGDMPSGQYPIFKLSDGTVVPYTVWNKRTWSDGSWKFACFLVRCPESVAGSATVSLQVYSGGTAPGTSGITLSQLYAELITMSATGGLTGGNVSGSWTADLSSANTISAITFGDGDAGIVWRLRCNFNQSASPHGQLISEYWVMGLKNASGGLAGWRVLQATSQIWYDVNTPAKNSFAFATLQMQWGSAPTVYNAVTTSYPSSAFSITATSTKSGTTLTGGGAGTQATGTLTFAANPTSGQNIALNGVTWTFVSSGASGNQTNIQGTLAATLTQLATDLGASANTSINVASYSASATVLTITYKTTGTAGNSYTLGGGGGSVISCPSHGLDSYTAIYLTGALVPPGFSANQIYWAYPVDANNIYVLNQSGYAQSGYTAYAAVCTDGGSGTVNPCSFIPFGCVQWTAQNDGRYTFIQGAGSYAADSTLRIQADKTYDRASKVLPPYDLSIGAVTNNLSVNWRPYAAGHLDDNEGDVSERDELGFFSAYSARHFYTQALVDETCVRVLALAQGNLFFRIYNSSTGTIPNCSNTSYAGLPAPNTLFGYNASFTGTSATTIQQERIISWDISHFPDFSGYAYLALGEPHLWDLLVDATGIPLVMISSYYTNNRNITVGGTTYYNCVTANRGQTRACGWATRTLVVGACLLPDSSPDGAQTTKYYQDAMASNFAMLVAYAATEPAWWATSGYWLPPHSASSAHRASWQINYNVPPMCYAAACGEDSNAMTMVNWLAKWPAYIKSQTGQCFVLITYYETSSQDGGPGSDPPLQDFDHWGGIGQYTGVSWTTSGFTWNGVSRWTPGDGDKVLFNTSSSLPGGYSQMTPYYAVGTSGSNFSLAATPGGTALAPPTNSGSLVGNSMYIVQANPPSTGQFADSSAPDGYLANQYGATNWMMAVGATGLTAAQADLASRISSGGTSYTGNPKYCTASSY